MNSPAKRICIRATLVLLALAASSCGVMRPPGMLPPGTSIDEARRSFGGPTGQYRLPNGGTRLEFAQGSFGRQTFMLDFDAGGRLVANQQVLTEANFANIKPGMTQQELLMTLGRPAWVFGVRLNNATIWNYRFFTGDCVIFQVSVAPEGRVIDAAQGYDPACDGPNTRD